MMLEPSQRSKTLSTQLSISDIKTRMMDAYAISEEDEQETNSAPHMLQEKDHKGIVVQKKSRSMGSYSESFGRRSFARSKSESSWDILDERHALPVNSDIPARVHRMLTSECEKGISLLHILQKPVTSKFDATLQPVMPLSAIKFSKALAFLWKSKVGCMASYSSGRGFIIYQLEEGVWSAPCFLKDTFVSFGLTLGVLRQETIYALPTDASIFPFLNDMFKSTADLNMIDVSGPTFFEEEDEKGQVQNGIGDRGQRATQHHGQIRSYTRKDGVIMDISWRCGLEMIDAGLNALLYGEEMTHRDIMEGHVQIPDMFRPLYASLKELLDSIPYCKETVSPFEVQRKKLALERIRRSSTASSKSFPSSHNKMKRSSSRGHFDSCTDSSPSDTITSSAAQGKDHDQHVLFGDDFLLDLDLGDRE